MALFECPAEGPVVSVTEPFFHAARACLRATDPEQKCALTRALCADLASGRLAVEVPVEGRAYDQPGQPLRPRLVAPRELPRRRLNNAAGRAALLHAIAHIEFNAINLAWDAVCRFAALPENYYRDWARVAGEEAEHFQLLRARLADLGYHYGDFPAHNGLWEMALKTRDDVLLRMALVPRVLEARGLDVTPAMIERLQAVGDFDSVAVLEIILRDEIGHVAIGTHWFKYLCAQRDLQPEATFRQLLRQHLPGRVKGPFHRAARQQAGFSAQELQQLEQLESVEDL